MPPGEIAVITSSGRAYFKIVTELKKRGETFLSLTPQDPIPFGVRAVVTTVSERSGVDHNNVFSYGSGDDLVQLIDEVIQAIRGKNGDGKLVLGVDPGKRVGLAVMRDGSPLRAMTAWSIEDAVNKILEAVNGMESEERVIKIGDGAPAYNSHLTELLDERLPPDVILESVEEGGTTNGAGVNAFPKRGKDVNSAILISMRKGSRLKRRSVDA